MKKTLYILIVLSLIDCDLSGYSSGIVGKAIRAEVREKKSSEVDLAAVIPFNWDQLHLFNPYTQVSMVCEKLSISASECESQIKDVSVDDGEMYMVFLLPGYALDSSGHYI